MVTLLFVTFQLSNGFIIGQARLCVCVCVSVSVLRKVSVINRGLSSPVGGEFHKEVCVCVLREMERVQKRVTRLSVSPSACSDTVALLVSGKACVSWHRATHPVKPRVYMHGSVFVIR